MKRDTSEDLSDAMDSRWQDRKEAIGTIRGSRGGIEPLEYSDQQSHHDDHNLETKVTKNGAKGAKQENQDIKVVAEDINVQDFDIGSKNIDNNMQTGIGT